MRFLAFAAELADVGSVLGVSLWMFRRTLRREAETAASSVEAVAGETDPRARMALALGALGMSSEERADGVVVATSGRPAPLSGRIPRDWPRQGVWVSAADLHAVLRALPFDPAGILAALRATHSVLIPESTEDEARLLAALDAEDPWFGQNLHCPVVLFTGPRRVVFARVAEKAGFGLTDGDIAASRLLADLVSAAARRGQAADARA